MPQIDFSKYATAPASPPPAASAPIDFSKYAGEKDVIGHDMLGPISNTVSHRIGARLAQNLEAIPSIPGQVAQALDSALRGPHSFDNLVTNAKALYGRFKQDYSDPANVIGDVITSYLGGELGPGERAPVSEPAAAPGPRLVPQRPAPSAASSPELTLVKNLAGEIPGVGKVKKIAGHFGEYLDSKKPPQPAAAAPPAHWGKENIGPPQQWGKTVPPAPDPFARVPSPEMFDPNLQPAAPAPGPSAMPPPSSPAPYRFGPGQVPPDYVENTPTDPRTLAGNQGRITTPRLQLPAAATVTDDAAARVADLEKSFQTGTPADTRDISARFEGDMAKRPTRVMSPRGRLRKVAPDQDLTQALKDSLETAQKLKVGRFATPAATVPPTAPAESPAPPPAAAQSAAAAPKQTSELEPVPEGYHRVRPHLRKNPSA